MINKALEEFLERRTLEEKRWIDTLEAIESVTSGKVIPENDVNEWLDSWGSENELEPPKQ